MDEERKMDPSPPAAAPATASGTPTASRGSSTGSSWSSNSHPSAPAPASTGTPPSAVVPWAARAGDSCYYPGCRKDANCACDICLASIDATRDLVRAPEAASARRFFAGAAASKGRRPALFCRERGAGAGEGSELNEPPWTPPMRSTAKSRRAPGKAAPVARGGRVSGARASHDWALYAATVLGFLLLLWVDTGLVPEAAARGFGPKLTPEAVARVGAEARLAPGGLEHKLRVLERRVGQLVGGERARVHSVWRLHQNDQRVIHWRCTVYKSVAEEVSVWGSPLRTSGLLPATLSARHLTLLSGEITEWSDGKVWPTVRASNGSSWAYRRQSAAAVRLEPETWVLEYQRSSLFEGTRLIPAAAELLASRCSTMARWARRRLQAKRRLFGGAQANPT